MSNRLYENNTDTPITKFGPDTIQYLPQAPEYIKALTQQGASTYVENARVEMKAIIVDVFLARELISHFLKVRT